MGEYLAVSMATCHSPCWGNDECEDTIGVLREPLDDGEGKRRRLPTACLCTAYTVSTWRRSGRGRGGGVWWGIYEYRDGGEYLPVWAGCSSSVQVWVL